MTQQCKSPLPASIYGQTQLTNGAALDDPLEDWPHGAELVLVVCCG